MTRLRVGLNPLPWVLTPQGFELSVPILRGAFAEIATTPFRGIHADPPAELDAAGYRSLLTEFGLEPAPGYFSANFHVTGTTELVEAAKRHAAVQAELGNTVAFVAAGLTSERIAHPSVGYGGDSLLPRVIDGIGAAAEAITAEGVTPALHPHVGSTIEIEPEIRAVLDAVPASVLSFGPDTGHLAWAGMTPATLITQYADRVAAVHVKDVHLYQADAARNADANYFDATVTKFTVWTEPGRGDVDLIAAISALPDTY
ncbi:MAG: TIM barrel protein, partial [Kribbellaceae bacterium]|nr:TIM barrel protein [Kribbellaceae bacterium]